MTPIIQRGKVNVIIDGQWGSSGKGKLAGWLYANNSIDFAVCDYMPNAGHTVEHAGKTMVFRQLPVGAMFPNVRCLIGPHAAIDVALLLHEIAEVERVMGHTPLIHIHSNAAVITEADKEAEAMYRGSIASTAKGGHSASTRKVFEPMKALIAGSIHELQPFTYDTQEFLVSALGHGATALVETAQGFDLGLNHGWKFPYVTGRDCTVGRALDNAGVPVTSVGSIVGCIRTFPIRVGNTEQGQSGPCYPDQNEITWTDVSVSAGAEVRELTTVTKRVRRVFDFSWRQLSRFLVHTGPTHMFLNFVNYLDASPDKNAFLKRLGVTCQLVGCDFCLEGTGPLETEMIVHDDSTWFNRLDDCSVSQSSPTA